MTTMDEIFMRVADFEDEVHENMKQYIRDIKETENSPIK